jgi:flagellar motor switch protein FliN
VESVISEQPYDEPLVPAEPVDVAEPTGMSGPAVAEFEPLEPTPAAQPANDADLARLHAVPVELAVEIGRTRMTIGDALALGPGSIVTLNRMAGEPIDLLVNGRRIARGEVVVIDEEFGLRVTEVVASVTDGA